jgi:hypothetical protein
MLSLVLPLGLLSLPATLIAGVLGQGGTITALAVKTEQHSSTR